MYLKYFKPFPYIETERLILRKVKKSDAADLYEYCRSSISAKFADWAPHENLGVTKQYISWLLSSVRRGEYMTWVIEIKETGKVIGTCSFTSMDKSFRVAEIGYGIISSYWGKGFATEAVSAIMEYGFCTIGLCRIFARIMKENVRSIHLASRVGMECEGFMKKAVWCKEAPHDLYYYAITDDMYENIIQEAEEEVNGEDRELQDQS